MVTQPVFMRSPEATTKFGLRQTQLPLAWHPERANHQQAETTFDGHRPG